MANRLNALKLNTTDKLKTLGEQGPLSASSRSPFISSPVIASSLLLHARKIAATEADPSTPIIMHPVTLPTAADLEANNIDKKNEVTIFGGQVRPISVAAYQDLLFLIRVAKWKVAYAKGEPFQRTEQLPYFGRFDEEVVNQIFQDLITEIWPAKADNSVPGEAKLATELAQKIIDPDTPIPEIVGALQKAFELTCRAIDRFGGGQYSSFNNSKDAVSVFSLVVKPDPERLIISWDANLGETLLVAISSVAQKLRDDDNDPSFIDYLVFHVGYELLRSGAKLDTKDARWMGTVGFRTDTQTYVSLTDPGEGHVFGTTRKARWVKGAIVHVEHLERPGNLAREEIESYRIPSIFEFARVRLHTGSSAPNTYFVGRRVKDSTSGDFSLDFIKVVNLTSAACSAAFQLGAAETKVAMDGLSASEAVAYMRALSGHVLRHHKQILSAAFNLNSPFIDDLAEPNADGEFPKVTEQMDIGRRGIELASMGGFDKVTFDGAADTYPSYCVILQLSFQNALELVHRAHQVGLLTYFSAGFKFDHIGDAVLAGVDGIGIGGAQILRYMDNETGHQGPYTEEFIDKIDTQRDTAANSIRGKGVHLLCRLDRMFVEGSIWNEEEALRQPLYDALAAVDEEKITKFLKDPILKRVIALPADGENPVLGQAKRLLRPGIEPLLLKDGGEVVRGKWAKFVIDLQSLVDAGDELMIAQYYASQPWSQFRELYRSSKPGLREDKFFTIKATPYQKPQ
ncbi:hypothetical protein BT69DRAFT_1338064 [Atractiella rhizophila]|nr:hypothetical protein BT69DRAFT_1338064 [Atractiella rhizophila]